MGTLGEICRKNTELTSAQTEFLEAGVSILQLVADLAHALVTIHVRGNKDNCLLAVAQARPNTSFVQFRPNYVGSQIEAAEEPLVWRTLTGGEPISGYREWALGLLMAMYAYPLRGPDGEIIGAISFDANFEDASEILIETAYLLLSAVGPDTAKEIYRPLSAQDGIMVVDETGKICFANEAATSIYKILGVSRILGRRAEDRQLNARLATKAASARQFQEGEVEIGNIILAQRAIPIVRFAKAERTVLIMTNITEVKKKEKELLIKSAVIQEIHHRVKNNLQTIASLLRLQARRTSSSEVKAALKESVNRILSISVVHEFLSQQDAEIIDVAEVAKNILKLVVENMLDPGFQIETKFRGQKLILPSEQATSLALVINELLLNAIEHGFVGRRKGIIGMDIAITRDTYRLEIWDNGIGLPEDFTPQGSSSLGLQIIRTLIEEDLGGQFQLFSQEGTHACITVPRNKEGG